MGSCAHVVVNGGHQEMLGVALRRIAALEARWSRFLLDSEVSHLNRHPGTPIEVSPQTFELIEHAIAAWRATDGRYDPTVLPAVCAAGYDRDFAALPADDPVRAAATTPSPGCAGIEIDRDRCAVELPVGVELDPGGIGKGLAADLVTRDLALAGVDGSMVNLGGDIRVQGEPPSGDSWSVAVEDPSDPARNLFTVGLLDAGVATSSRLWRRWRKDGLPQHHIIDPRTGRPSSGRLVAVTAIATEAWWAEAVATSVFVDGSGAGGAGASDALIATVDADGVVEMSPRLAEVVR